MPVLFEPPIEANLVSLGGQVFTLDLGDPALAPFLSGTPSFTTMYVRSQDGHFRVGGIDVVPEPGTLLLLGSGLGAVALLRRRLHPAA